MTDDEGEKEVEQEMEAARKKAQGDAKKGSHLNEGLRQYQREVCDGSPHSMHPAPEAVSSETTWVWARRSGLVIPSVSARCQGRIGPTPRGVPTLSVLPTWADGVQSVGARRRSGLLRSGPTLSVTGSSRRCSCRAPSTCSSPPYEMLTAEQSMLANRFHFRYMVLDEAQRVKNDSSLVSQAVRRIRTTASLLLTGTPLQNSLHELRALVSVLFQDVLEAAGAGEMEVDADAAFGDDSAVAAARALLQPLMLPPHQGRGAPRICPRRPRRSSGCPSQMRRGSGTRPYSRVRRVCWESSASTNATSEKGALRQGHVHRRGGGGRRPRSVVRSSPS